MGEDKRLSTCNNQLPACIKLENRKLNQNMAFSVGNRGLNKKGCILNARDTLLCAKTNSMLGMSHKAYEASKRTHRTAVMFFM